MVLSRPTALAEIAGFFAAHPDTDHVEVPVQDHFTGQLIPGVHVFSARVAWPRLDRHDGLFVDPSPVYPGRFRRAPADLPPFVDHAPDPSDEQAFHFGYHRALKLYQPGRRLKRVDRGRLAFQTLSAVQANHDATGRRSLALALAAAERVRQGRLHGSSGDKGGRALEAALAETQALDPETLAAQLWRRGRRLGGPLPLRLAQVAREAYALARPRD